MFLSVESDCFGQGNGFRQFSESLEWLGHVLNFSEISCGPPSAHPMVPCGPPFGFDPNFSKHVFISRK